MWRALCAAWSQPDGAADDAAAADGVDVLAIELAATPRSRKSTRVHTMVLYQLVSLQIPLVWRHVFHTQGHPTADLGSHSHQSWAPLED